MSPRAFQAAQLDPAPDPPPLTSAAERRLGDVANSAPASPKIAIRRYRAEDFHYSSSARDQVDSWFLQYPALRKRNFFTVQNHHATANHFDLRLHVSGGLFSFAIPRGLSPTTTTSSSSSDSRRLSRLAVETSIHPLNYALFEGVGRTGTTAVWDVGEYRVLPTKKKERERNRLLDQGMDDGDTTTDGSNSDDKDADRGGRDSPSEAEDERQEALLRKALGRSSFSSGTIDSAARARTIDAKRDGGETRGFVPELIGKRYRGLRITLARSSSNFETVKRKMTGVLYRSPRWYCTLHDPSGSTPLARIDNPDVARDRSLLTGRTMDEVRAAAAGGRTPKPRGSGNARGRQDAGEEDADETTDDEGERAAGERAGGRGGDGDEIGDAETQGLLDTEGDELEWFEARASTSRAARRA
ncbi:hypothetical protein JCM11491_004227 [Sporobolomyces phaffii]